MSTGGWASLLAVGSLTLNSATKSDEAGRSLDHHCCAECTASEAAIKQTRVWDAVRASGAPDRETAEEVGTVANRPAGGALEVQRLPGDVLERRLGRLRPPDRHPDAQRPDEAVAQRPEVALRGGASHRPAALSRQQAARVESRGRGDEGFIGWLVCWAGGNQGRGSA